MLHSVCSLLITGLSLETVLIFKMYVINERLIKS